MRVRWRLTKARHAAASLEVVEWSEQLRPVTSVWIGAVRRSVRVRLCTSGCKSEKMFGIISPPRDLFHLNSCLPLTEVDALESTVAVDFTWASSSETIKCKQQILLQELLNMRKNLGSLKKCFRIMKMQGVV